MSKTAFYTRFYTADTSGYGKRVLSPIYQKKKTGQALYNKRRNDNDRSRIKTFRDDGKKRYHKAVIKIGGRPELVSGPTAWVVVVYKNKGHTGRFAGAERSSI